jgi:hypothetical protein
LRKGYDTQIIKPSATNPKQLITEQRTRNQNRKLVLKSAGAKRIKNNSKIGPLSRSGFHTLANTSGVAVSHNSIDHQHGVQMINRLSGHGISIPHGEFQSIQYPNSRPQFKVPTVVADQELIDDFILKMQ